jgi:hypothetical protein
VAAVVIAFVAWQILRIHHAVHTAFYQRPYREKSFRKALDAYEKRAETHSSLVQVKLGTGGVTFVSLEPHAVRQYRIDENGKVLKAQELPMARVVQNAFPVASVQVEAPQRIFDAIAADTGRDDYLMTATLERNIRGALRWKAQAGKLGFGTGDYEAVPDGTITKRPLKLSLVPAPTRPAKYARCIGAAHSVARIKRCQRLYLPAKP